MSFPPGYTTRAPTMADAAAVIALVNAGEAADIGEPLLDLSDIESDWASPLLDLEQDAILVFDGDRLVAFGDLHNSRADAAVHPDDRGRGIGSGLLDWLEARMVTRTPPNEPARIGQSVPESAGDAAALFRSRGYERKWDSWILRLGPHADLAVASLPAGVEIRPCRPDEEHAVYRVIDDAFNEWEDRRSTPFEDWQAMTTARPDFDPSLLFVAVESGEVIGACVALRYPGDGWVDQLAVRKDRRGQGIARSLLARAYGELRERGETRLGLNTDSRTGALDLYLKLGMYVEHTFVHWAKELRPAAG